MNIHLERGKLLLAQNRLSEAEREFKEALAEQPNDAYAMAWLAECYLNGKRFAEALEISEAAMRFAPDSSFLLYTLARSYFYNKRIKEARETAGRALSLNPNDPDFFLLLAHIEFYEENWHKALDAAEQGLALDPEHVNLINLRTQALVKLNRKAEAAATIDYALHHAPEDSYSHSNKGWVAMEQGNYEQAFGHFREALRLAPNNGYARAGLKEAIKAKNFLYRGILKYFLWISKMNQQGRWVFIIGIYIFYRILIEVAEKSPALAPFLYPFIGLYILFAFSSWIAMPVSNLFLRLHPLGKYALDDDERKASTIVGLLAAGSAIALLAWWLTDLEILLSLGIYLLLLLLPVGGLFSVDAQGKARKQLSYYTYGLAAIGLVGAFTSGMNILVIVFLLGIFAYSWVANYLIGKDAREFR
ncbi:MAG: tetratricopeptide repeat protein [Lewinellaceae bacterium]|nr:tetratricopeptide repeat protein [Phaeodactylibacter sp.]MCB9350782.1 tetratricopeptide repeat protein [Lewinellaceae bacterium]